MGSGGEERKKITTERKKKNFNTVDFFFYSSVYEDLYSFEIFCKGNKNQRERNFLLSEDIATLKVNLQNKLNSTASFQSCIEWSCRPIYRPSRPSYSYFKAMNPFRTSVPYMNFISLAPHFFK